MDADVRTRRFTVDEYHLMATVGVLGPDERTELLDGTIVEMSPIGERHVVRHARIVEMLVRIVPERFTVYGQGSFPIGRENEPQPDIAFGPRLAPHRERRPAVHELHAVIELADSSLAIDLGTKMRLYARGRVPNYLVVDLERDVVVVHRSPHDLAYEQIETYGKGRSFALDGIDDVAFEADAFRSPS